MQKNEELNCGEYIARNSIYSCTSVPFDLIFESRLTSNFRQRSLENDLYKKTFEKLNESGNKNLIVDFIDTTRFSLVEFDEELHTRSIEFVDSGIEQQYAFKKINHFTYNYSHECDVMDQFINQLRGVYEEKNIILHCAYFKYQYIDKNMQINDFPEHRIELYRKYNNKIDLYHKLFKERLNCKIIDHNSDDKWLANENHIWGLSPMHYTDDYYKCVLNDITMLLEG